jgi:tetratricopeptide (TPR) repeat protein
MMEALRSNFAPSSLVHYEHKAWDADWLLDKSHSYKMQDEWKRAEHCALEASEIYGEMGDYVDRAIAQLHLAGVYQSVGELEQARERSKEAYQVFQRQPARIQRHNEAIAAYMLGVLHEPELSRDGTRALYWYEKASEQLEKAQDYFAEYNNRQYYMTAQQLSQWITVRTKQILKGITTQAVSPLLRRHTDVLFPEYCAINQTVSLSIQIVLESPPSGLNPLVGGRAREVDLIVFVSANAFEVDKRWRKLSMPFGRDSERVEFELVGQELGTQLIEVELFYRTDRVGYIVVETEVVGGATSGQDRQIIYEDDYDSVRSNDKRRSDVLLKVEYKENSILCEIIVQDAWPSCTYCTPVPVERGSELDFWNELTNSLEKAVKFLGKSERGRKSIQINVETLGAELHRQLLSRELKEHSASWNEHSVIVINTNERWIPWELIFDGDDFWGNKFILARQPRISSQKSLGQLNRAKRQLASTSLRNAVHIIGDLDESSKEKVKGLFSAKRSEILVKPWLEDVIQSIKGADLVHFTCHGHVSDGLCLQLLNDQDPCLKPHHLNGLSGQLFESLIVFANACMSATPSRFLGGLCNFGWRFYEVGGPGVVYIGTLGLVPMDYAISFSKQFYERLFSGHTVGESLYYAKSAVEQDHPFRLLYTIYGDPFAIKSI